MSTTAAPANRGHTLLLPSSGWARISRVVAVLAVVLIAMRFQLPYQQFAGTLFAGALAPVWLPVLWRSRWGRRLLLCGIGAAGLGIAMTWLATGTNPTSTSLAWVEVSALAGLVASVGAVYWARTLLSDGTVVVWYGIGSLLAIRPGAGMYAENPWKFGFSVGVTLIALGVAQFSSRKWPSVVLLITLGLVSALNDARSSFAILLIAAVLVLWQAVPRKTTRRSTSLLRYAFTLLAVAVAVYNLGQALILEGALGEATRARSVEQVNTSGSMLLGGRPELGATWALLLHRPWGFGSGTFVNWQELMLAKAGMAQFNYDPDNGYVEQYMFGNGIELHSTAADLWARFGVLGAALAVIMVIIMLRAVADRMARRTATAVLLFLAIKTIWNFAFGPLYTSVALLVLLLAIALPRPEHRAQTESDPVPGPPQRGRHRLQ